MDIDGARWRMRSPAAYEFAQRTIHLYEEIDHYGSIAARWARALYIRWRREQEARPRAQVG